MERIKLKITSDGTNEGTVIKDDTGRVLDNATEFSFHIDAQGIPVVKLTLVGVPVEINYDAQLTSLEELDKQEFEQTTVVFKPVEEQYS